MTKVSDVPIVKEVDINVVLFSFKTSYFNIIVHLLIAIGVIYPASKLRISVIPIPTKFLKDDKPKYIFAMFARISGWFRWRGPRFCITADTERKRRICKFLHENSPYEPGETNREFLVRLFCRRYGLQEDENGEPLLNQSSDEELCTVVCHPVVANSIIYHVHKDHLIEIDNQIDKNGESLLNQSSDEELQTVVIDPVVTNSIEMDNQAKAEKQAKAKAEAKAKADAEAAKKKKIEQI